jgi:putative methylase
LIQPFPVPKVSFEQYTIPVDVAAVMLHVAAYIHQSIIGKKVLDLGCGTGRLALGAAFLDAEEVLGVDIDKNAITLAYNNSVKMNLKEKIQWVATEINAIHGHFDTVLQNPPFGVQNQNADRNFLRKALEVGKTIFSLHNHPFKNDVFLRSLKAGETDIVPVSPVPFISNLIEKYGGEIQNVYALKMTIPHMFPFHTKQKYEFLADLYVINSIEDNP